MSRVVTVQEVVNAERFAFVPGRNWLVTCDADGTIPLNSRIVAEFVKEPPAELIAAMEALPELLTACKAMTEQLAAMRSGLRPDPYDAEAVGLAVVARAEGGAA